MPRTLETRLLDHARHVAWPALPPAVQAATRAFLFDTLSVGIAGHAAAFAAPIAATVAGWSNPDHGHAPAFLLGGDGAGLPAPAAAFVNAYQIHAQEYDCVHEPAVAHPMATVTAALLAEAARSPVSGVDFLAAIVAGVDVVATLGVAATGPLTFFRPATAGIFGSVAALIRLRRLSPEVAADAFGLALAFAGGTMQAHVEGKPTLAVQVAAAARGAVEAVDLARAGIPGPDGALTGPYGYFALFERAVDAAAPRAALGIAWRIAELSWKPFPTGRAAHGGLVALRQAMAGHGVTAATFDGMTYRAPPLIQRLVGRPAVAGMSLAYARLCLPWLGALLLTRGQVGLAQITVEALADPALLDLAARIRVEVDGNPDQAAFGPASATIHTRDGARIDIAVDRQWGAPAWPLTAAEQYDKAAACLAFAGFAPDRVAPLHAAVMALDTADDVAAALAPVVRR